MAENFDVCLATRFSAAGDLRELFNALAKIATPFIASPVWASRIRGHDVSHHRWENGEIDPTGGWLVALYPMPRSSELGSWLVELVGTDALWTLSLPMPMVAARAVELSELLFAFGEISEPCIAGPEYSMASIKRAGLDVLAEAETEGSLATRAVVSQGARMRNWEVIMVGPHSVLMGRAGADLLTPPNATDGPVKR